MVEVQFHQMSYRVFQVSILWQNLQLTIQIGIFKYKQNLNPPILSETLFIWLQLMSTTTNVIDKASVHEWIAVCWNVGQ